MSPLPRPAAAASYHAWHVVIASLAVAAVIGCVYVGQHGWELAEFDFDRPGDPEGWVARGGISALEGRLVIVPATRDPLLVFPARFPARSVGWVRLRIRFVAEAEVAAAVGAGEYEALHHELTLAWTRTDGTAEPEASVSATALFDGSYHDCDLPVRSHDAWRGEIGSLVLDALDARAPRVRIEVDRIALLGHRPTPAGSFPVLLTLAALWALTAWLVVGRPSRPVARLRSGLARTLVACLAPATVLFVAEAVLNMLSFERPFESAVVQVLVNEAEDPTYRDLFRYDPRCLFTQRPGVEYRRGEPINSLGLRGRLPARERTPGTPRVATFGDSSTFGLGLPLDETYPASGSRSAPKRSTGA
jgi:hypothetical protein